MTSAEFQQYVQSEAASLGLDPAAVLAVSSQEGIGGGIGDSGTSFGPFQLHAGGALPAGQYTGPYSTVTQAWAWSKEGIDYALQQIAGVARGLTGSAAVTAIVTQFERPLHPQPEISGALSAYSQFANGAAPVSNAPISGGTGASGPAQPGSGGGTVTVSPCQDWSIAGATLPGTHIFCAVGLFFQQGGWGKILLTLLASGLIIGGGIIYVRGDMPKMPVPVPA